MKLKFNADYNNKVKKGTIAVIDNVRDAECK